MHNQLCMIWWLPSGLADNEDNKFVIADNKLSLLNDQIHFNESMFTRQGPVIFNLDNSWKFYEIILLICLWVN